MVTTFKNTSYRWLRERELPVGVRAKGRVCMCVCEERKRGDDGPAEGKAERGMGDGGGPERNVKMGRDFWRGGGSWGICVYVCV